MHPLIDEAKARAFASLRQRLLGRRMLSINTADRHHDHAVAERMRERANVIELVLSDLDSAERE